MFHEIPVARTKLQARKLHHTRITDLNNLREIYTLGDVIGRGNFGTVVKAKKNDTKAFWAIKIINKRQAGASRVLAVEREIYILKLVNHPNIIFLDCVFESPNAIYLVFELCIQSLAKVFKAEKQFAEAKAICVIQSLASALAYLHKNDIVHRDLKLENILTTSNPDDATDNLFIKVTDFGLSAMRTGTGHENMLHDFCGTLAYMAPEMIATKSYSQQCDVWSMGVILYLLLFGRFPFYSGNDQHMHQLIRKEEIDFSGLQCSPGARHLLSKLLEKNPALRITAAEVGHHPWILGDLNRLQTESSNVLDMMRLWRDELKVSTMYLIWVTRLIWNTKRVSPTIANIVTSQGDNFADDLSAIKFETIQNSNTDGKEKRQRDERRKTFAQSGNEVRRNKAAKNLSSAVITRSMSEDIRFARMTVPKKKPKPKH